MGDFIVYFIFIALLMLVIGLSIKVIQVNQVMIVERLGAYYKTLEAGIHFIFPSFDRVVSTLSLEEQLHKTNVQSFRTYDDIKVDLNALDEDLKQQLNESFGSLGLKISKANIII